MWYYLPWRSEKIYEVQSTYFSNRHWDGTYENGKKYMETTDTCAIAVMKDNTRGLLDFAQQYASEVGVKKVVQTKTAFLFYYETKDEKEKYNQ